MPSTSTTQIVVGSLLDLVGASAPAREATSDRSIFDALLQPERTGKARGATGATATLQGAGRSFAEVATARQAEGSA